MRDLHTTCTDGGNLLRGRVLDDASLRGTAMLWASVANRSRRQYTACAWAIGRALCSGEGDDAIMVRITVVGSRILRASIARFLGTVNERLRGLFTQCSTKTDLCPIALSPRHPHERTERNL